MREKARTKVRVTRHSVEAEMENNNEIEQRRPLYLWNWNLKEYT